jgi:hypothetical protein
MQLRFDSRSVGNKLYDIRFMLYWNLRSSLQRCKAKLIQKNIIDWTADIIL